MLYAGAGLAAALAILLSSAYAGGIPLLLFCAVVGLVVHYLGYEEFDAARQVIFGGLVRRVLSGNLSIHRLELAIRSAVTLDECWDALVQASREFGVSRATLHVPGRQFAAVIVEANLEDCWSLSIPVNGSGYLYWSIPFHSQSSGSIAPLALSVRTVLGARLDSLLLVPHEAAASELPEAQEAEEASA